MLCGELDEYTANYTRSTLDALMAKGAYSKVIIDLSQLEFMDSTGVGVLIGRYKKLKGKNVNAYICNPTPTIEKIFVMSGLYQIMPKIS